MRLLAFSGIAVLLAANIAFAAEARRPNILFILTDDQRHDALGCAGNDLIQTPNLDALAARGVRFENAFVTLSICSPSRAACMTGQYNSRNGVTRVGAQMLSNDAPRLPKLLRAEGYRTAMFGKWHLGDEPADLGFDEFEFFTGNGPYYNRSVKVGDETKTVEGFIDDYVAQKCINFVNKAAKEDDPFFLWMCTQVPHMNHKHQWNARKETLQSYEDAGFKIPASWSDDLSGKPAYLKNSRSRQQALNYRYDTQQGVLNHLRDYYAAVTEVDASIGLVLNRLTKLGLDKNTWIVFMGDNGWLLGEHQFTSKVLAYEESIRVPMVIAGPNTRASVQTRQALNIDLAPTILDLAGLPIDQRADGVSLRPLLNAQADNIAWRDHFVYEAPDGQLGSQPLWAVRTDRWKYILTQLPDDTIFEEIYDLQTDPAELKNLAGQPPVKEQQAEFKGAIDQHRNRAKRMAGLGATEDWFTTPPVGSGPPEKPYLQISGIYPHLSAFNTPVGGPVSYDHGECGTGAIVPWSDRLWYITYPQHQTRGSRDKLYEIDEDLNITARPESVGGTHANRMIHRETNQLIIGAHLIDSERNVRTIDVQKLVGRMTATARHLSDPANKVYFFDMEGSLYEVNVHSLEVTKLFAKPVPGWHGKGGYTAQGRLVLANNGGSSVRSHNYDKLQIGGPPEHPEDAGVLAQWDGDQWRIVERRQFTDVTGPGGLLGSPDDQSPLWAMGWDKRSLLLKLLDDGQWYRFRLPKGSHTFDPKHGYFTEWPRIREVTDRRFLMVKHGTMFDFPRGFCARATGGIRPIATHLRYVPDFCAWNGRLVIGSDDTSLMANPRVGQPQSNLWFGQPAEIENFGPRAGWGGVWQEDEVGANEPSDPLLFAGYEQRTLHLANHSDADVSFTIEIDADGTGRWSPWQQTEVSAEGYCSLLLPVDLTGEWLRLKTDRDATVTAYLHGWSPRKAFPSESELFAGLADVRQDAGYTTGRLRTSRHDRSLQFLKQKVNDSGETNNEQYVEVHLSDDGSDLEFIEPAEDRADEVREFASVEEAPFEVDAASVILRDRHGNPYRIPKGAKEFDQPCVWGWPRGISEAVSERYLANIHGTFYEIPRAERPSKDEPDIERIKPVSSHSKIIADFCTWRGLFVISGVRSDAKHDGQVFGNPSDAALWFGHIDDLWRLGKPTGVGGTWLDTAAVAGKPSDPYLMTGYDRKRLELSHREKSSIHVSLEINFDHGGWHQYTTLEVPAGETVTYEFPAGFHAHWCRLTSDTDCTATARFIYE